MPPILITAEIRDIKKGKAPMPNAFIIYTPLEERTHYFAVVASYTIDGEFLQSTSGTVSIAVWQKRLCNSFIKNRRCCYVSEKNKGKILRKGRRRKLRGAREYPICRRTRIRIIQNFSFETTQVREEWHEIFKALKWRNGPI